MHGNSTQLQHAWFASESAYSLAHFAKCHALQSVGRLENAVGWYHSHPGYGCWLSGIDCSTQMTQQQYNEPFLAIVVDPHRTIAAGKVEIGAFRTYPEVMVHHPDAPPRAATRLPIGQGHTERDIAPACMHQHAAATAP
jgi:proteasome lid subunit RPN8/RPN11